MIYYHKINNTKHIDDSTEGDFSVVDIHGKLEPDEVDLALTIVEEALDVSPDDFPNYFKKILTEKMSGWGRKADEDYIDSLIDICRDIDQFASVYANVHMKDGTYNRTEFEELLTNKYPFLRHVRILEIIDRALYWYKKYKD